MGRDFLASSHTCFNMGDDKTFICSRCGAIITGTLLDDFDYTVEYAKAARCCAMCGAEILRKII